MRGIPNSPSENKQSAVYFRRRNQFLDLYGHKCECCGETHDAFLTIEHKKGQRGKKKETTYHALSAACEKYRPDLYGVLCMNCNHATRYGQPCPHKILILV